MVGVMPVAGQFIAHLQGDWRIGNVSYETEQHFTYECRKPGPRR
jgi:hypothetical protein